MNDRISKAQPGRSCVRRSKRLQEQEQLLNAIAAPSPAAAGLPRDAPAGPSKSQVDEIDQSPAKRNAPLTDAQQPEVEGEGADELGFTPVLQHPRPILPYASFLEKFANPFQPSPRADSEHSRLLEWLESVGSDRDTRCRSDSHLQLANSSPIPRRIARSAPAMGDRQAAYGCTVPSTPASVWSFSQTDADIGPNRRSGPSSRYKSLVEDDLYRDVNLAANNIYLRPPWSYPEHIGRLVDHMGRDRDSPGPSPVQVRQDVELQDLENEAGESEVAKYFLSTDIFPNPGSFHDLKRADKLPIARRLVPDVGSAIKVSIPVPDLLYGYNRKAFSDGQQTQLTSMGNEMVVNTGRLIYPFLAVEIKGDAGSMRVATNQCLGGSTLCVNTAEGLNRHLGLCKNGNIDSAAFSIAMNGTEARLFISWKHNELDHYTARLKSFALQEPEQYIEFRKYVRNIIDWGKGERLEGIRKSLDSLLEESQKRTWVAAKSRKPPSADCAGSSSKKRKTR